MYDSDTKKMIASTKVAEAIDALNSAGVKSAWIEFESGQIVEIGIPLR